MSEQLNVGVIGCGRVAQAQHLRVLASLPSVRLVALADAHRESLNKAGSRFAPDATTHGDYSDMLGHPDMQAVVICLPTALHADAAIASIKAGKALYLEKPIGVDVAEAERVMQAYAEADVPAQLGFNYRFHPAYIALRDELRAGRIGEVAAATSMFCSPPRELQGWKSSRATGGGVLLDLFVHHADLATFLLDEPVASVFAASRSVRTEADTASITMTTASGIAIQTTVSAVAAQADEFRVTGDKGLLRAGRFSQFKPNYAPIKRSFAIKDRLASTLREAAALPRRVMQELIPKQEPSYHAALSSFVDAVLAGQAPQPGLEAGYRAAVVVEAAEESARTGKVVHVSDSSGRPAATPAGQSAAQEVGA
ncbi:MAG: Gfo/Idh/MocA family oxidoreductase [Planctomycetota bacterium]